MIEEFGYPRDGGSYDPPAMTASWDRAYRQIGGAVDADVALAGRSPGPTSGPGRAKAARRMPTTALCPATSSGWAIRRMSRKAGTACSMARRRGDAERVLDVGHRRGDHRPARARTGEHAEREHGEGRLRDCGGRRLRVAREGPGALVGLGGSLLMTIRRYPFV